MSATPKRTPHVQIIDGVPRSPLVKPEVYRQAFKFEPTANDVVLVTHPKSGTHWISQIALLVLNRGQCPTDLADLCRQAPFIEMNGVPVALKTPRFLRTHFPFGQLPYNKDAKYIYVARNPYDTCVSFYHHVKNVPHYRFQGGTFEDFVDAFLEARVGQPDQLDHVLSGYALRHEPNVLFLTYEELKSDTAGCVLKLAKFFGEPYVSMFDQDPVLMEKILSKSSAEFMKRTYTASNDEFARIYNLCSLNPEDEAEVKFDVVRKGTADDWRAHFSPEQLKRMRAWIGEKTQNSDIMSIWGRELAETKPAHTD